MLAIGFTNEFPPKFVKCPGNSADEMGFFTNFVFQLPVQSSSIRQIQRNISAEIQQTFDVNLLEILAEISAEIWWNIWWKFLANKQDPTWKLS